MRHRLTPLIVIALIVVCPAAARGSSAKVSAPTCRLVEPGAGQSSDTPGQDQAEPPKADSLVTDPFNLPRDRIVPGTTFLLEIVQDGSAAVGDPAKSLFDPDQEKVFLDLEYATQSESGRQEICSHRVMTESIRIVDGHHYIEARMPAMRELKELSNQSRRGGVLCPYRATLVATIADKDGGNRHRLEYTVWLPSVAWAYFWGALAVFAIAFFVGFLRNGSGRSITTRWDPLGPTISPAGGYSLSLFQILIWTYVTVFGLVYVYRLTASLLDITPQMLVLLGVGGSTALAKKIASGDGIPRKYLALLPARTPRLRDLIWRGGEQGGLDLFKIQMLVFTVLIADIVMWEIARKYSFPNIPENLVALMGVSSALYVGNSATQQKDLTKSWQAIEPQAKALSKQIEKAQDPEKAELQEQLHGLLEELY